MTHNERELTAALHSLAASSPREASPELEARLTAAFRRETKKRKLFRWIPAIAATVAAAALFAILLRPPSVPPPPVAITYKPASPALTISTAPVTPAPRRRHIVRRPAPAPAPPNEVATSFFALPEARDLPPAEAATLVRVQVPRSTMRLVGLPVNEERANEGIRADMLLGQDGIARAVRFVQ
ncbi:MAG: hypothetical protein M3O35_17500 [Acidobacteriota bacterium]|nr:hypothetical protein [Acidobacteriota bacterium]